MCRRFKRRREGKTIVVKRRVIKKGTKATMS